MKSLCVYCGSSAGVRPEYAQAARELAHEMVRRDCALVYGGASVGLMGVIADEVLKSGGRVTGVIPRSLIEKEVGHAGLGDLRVVGSMHERKLLMADLSDAFVALPGGLATLEELFEIWTWAQLGIHHKPIGLLNIEGYFDGLVRFVDHAVEQGFVRPAHRRRVVLAQSVPELLAGLETDASPLVRKWADR